MDGKGPLPLGSGKGTRWGGCSGQESPSHDGMGLPLGDLELISHVLYSCCPRTWTPCILKRLWKRRSSSA